MESRNELKKQIEELKTLNRDLKEDFQNMEVYKNEQKAKVSDLEEKLKVQWLKLKQLAFELREERDAKEILQNEKAERDQFLDTRVLCISSLTEEMRQLENDKNIEIEHLKKVVGAREGTVSNLENQLKDLLAQEKQQKSASERKIRDLKGNHVENIRKLQDEHSMKMSEQDEKIKKLQNEHSMKISEEGLKIKSLEEEINVQKQQLDKANADLEAAEKKIAELTDDAKSREAQFGDSQNANRELEKKLNVAEENVKALKDEFERAKKEQENLENAELKEVKERLERLQQTNGELDARLVLAENNETANQDLIALIRKELESTNRTKEDLNSELSQAKQELKEKETQLDSQNAKEELEGKLRVEDENVKALNARIADLEKNLQTQESASEQKIRDLEAEHVENIKKLQDEHSKKITEQVEKIKSLEDEMKAQKEKSEKANEDLEAAGKKIRELTDDSTNREAQLLEKHIAIHELEEKLNAAEKNVKTLESGESSKKRSSESNGGPLAKVQKTRMATDAPAASAVQAQLITAPVTVRKLIVIKPAPITIEGPAAAQSRLVPAPPAKHQPVPKAIEAPVAPVHQLQAIPQQVQIQNASEALAAPAPSADRQLPPMTIEAPVAPANQLQAIPKPVQIQNSSETGGQAQLAPAPPADRQLAPITIECPTAPAEQAQLDTASPVIPQIVQIQNSSESLAAPGGQAQLAPALPVIQQAADLQAPLPQMNLAAHLEAPSAQGAQDIVMQPIVNQPAPGPQSQLDLQNAGVDQGAPKKMHHKTAKKLKKDQAVAKRKQTIAEKKGALQ